MQYQSHRPPPVAVAVAVAVAEAVDIAVAVAVDIAVAVAVACHVLPGRPSSSATVLASLAHAHPGLG